MENRLQKGHANANVEMIQTFLAKLHPQGEAFEVRAISSGRGPQHQFFDDPAEAARWIQQTVSPAFYVSLNHLADVPQSGGAKGADYDRRQWLLIDCDSNRPKGRNATEDELESALRLRETIRQYLTAKGFPEPLEVMSGNGGHLLYRIDLPADSDLVRDVLHALKARFPGDGAAIDTTVHDVARITRIAGTLNAKNPTEPDRPQRTATLENPELEPQVVPEELLQRIVDDAPKPTPSREPRSLQKKRGPSKFADQPLPVLQRIESQCAFMARCRDDADTLSEPEWFAQASIAGKCLNGEELFHERSEPHPQYRWDETQQKLEHAAECGPRRCGSISLEFGGCNGCPHQGKVTSPIQVGRSHQIPGENVWQCRSGPTKKKMMRTKDLLRRR